MYIVIDFHEKKTKHYCNRLRCMENHFLSNAIKYLQIFTIKIKSSFFFRPGQTLSPEMSRDKKSVSPALQLVGRVLREQGLGRHIDEDFILAATTEMQEAMGMTPTEFEAAAAALLAAETEGAFRFAIKHHILRVNN